ncbi:MAG TPA: hypothetical protein DCL61_09780 [Cyanobacteria bacterium UBA12227]|nr:hypothetical protein [Cyanobacteria bacterium UBA12227]HAX86481.1 hypothetical protein [Cyanobacteria bacterium UBA11370]HBY76226.1 hypothetical protein [Cyanobacteria bacterium UBA11148]
MDKNEIHLNHINLRSRGIPPQIARSAIEGLGQEVMNNLAQQGLVQPGQKIQLGDLNLGRLRLQRRGDANELRTEIARVITSAITARIGRK